MSFEDKYKELIDTYELKDVTELYPEANAFEKCIITMRLKGLTYGAIQSNLGNPSKKIIRQVLLKYNPELIENNQIKVKKYVSAYSELYGILIKNEKTDWELFGDDAKLYIKDHIIYYNDEPLGQWSETEQIQILNEVKNQLK